jgi:lipopolysaccharide export LptBFGC system permease protein LptF
MHRVEYTGILPPPEMLLKFKEIDPTLLAKIVEFADRSYAQTDRQLDLIRELNRQDFELQSKELDRKQHDSETSRKAITHRANYDLRAQLIILVLVLGLIAASYLLAKEGNNAMATLLGAGGIVAVIGSAIRGVSKK